MVRYRFIENIVLNLYSQLPQLSFPLEPKGIIKYIPNCRYMSYQEFAELNNCDIQTVIELCKSESGCSQYDITNDRYLIICNEDQSFFGNTLGRQRWTCAHEIGHILCNHFSMSAMNMMSENSLMEINNKELEQEADAFAAVLLAPFPLFYQLNISSALDVKKQFGLSKLASENRFDSFVRWDRNHINRAWNNDICRLYAEKAY